MKHFLAISVLLSSGAFAQEIPWSETFKLPEGVTYRARMAGFDCGTFGTLSNTYVSAPEDFAALKIQYRQLQADKDLNKFLIEATFPGLNGSSCTYASYLDRNREDKTLDFTHSELASSGNTQDCAEGQAFLDFRMKKVPYEASKRGIRYIATQVITDEVNSVCESGIVRAVFDRRFE